MNRSLCKKKKTALIIIIVYFFGDLYIQHIGSNGVIGVPVA